MAFLRKISTFQPCRLKLTNCQTVIGIGSERHQHHHTIERFGRLLWSLRFSSSYRHHRQQQHCRTSASYKSNQTVISTLSAVEPLFCVKPQSCTITPNRSFSTTGINLSASFNSKWHETLYRNYSQHQSNSVVQDVPELTHYETHVSDGGSVLNVKPSFSRSTGTSVAYRSLISSEEINQRQQNLLRLTTEWLGHVASSGAPKQSPLILIASSPPQFQANSTIPVNDCKQNSDFTYFTGLHSGSSDQLTSDCVLALYLEDANRIDSVRSVIFSPMKTKSDVLWHGPNLKTYFQDYLTEICDEVQPLSDLVQFVNSHIKPNRRDVFISRNGLQFRPELVTHLKYYLKYTSRLNATEADAEKWSTTLTQSIPSVNVRDASSFIDQLRVIKSNAECLALKRVGKIGARALKNTMYWSRQMICEQGETFNFFESHIAAKFDFESRLYGSRKLSFPSVCASGPRSTIIHYGRNDHRIELDSDNCWVLTDVGCEDVDGYCCDISRTWPLDNTLMEATNFRLWLQLYEALVGVQHTLIQSIEIDKTSLDDLYHRMLDLLSQLLVAFDVFNSSVTKNDIQSLTKRLCPHHVSHYIGLDIHDTPTMSRSKPLQQGMCFSIEPGLYFPLEGLPIKEEFRGIGLRIEDDILIDPESKTVINLTADCPVI